MTTATRGCGDFTWKGQGVHLPAVPPCRPPAWGICVGCGVRHSASRVTTNLADVTMIATSPTSATDHREVRRRGSGVVGCGPALRRDSPGRTRRSACLPAEPRATERIHADPGVDRILWTPTIAYAVGGLCLVGSYPGLRGTVAAKLDDHSRRRLRGRRPQMTQDFRCGRRRSLANRLGGPRRGR